MYLDYAEVPWEKLKNREGELYHSIDHDRTLVVFDDRILPTLRSYLPDLQNVPAYKTAEWITPPCPSPAQLLSE